MHTNRNDPVTEAAAGEVIAFAPHAAAAWARAAQSAPSEAACQGVIVQFPRQCPAPRPHAALAQPRFKPDAF